MYKPAFINPLLNIFTKHKIIINNIPSKYILVEPGDRIGDFILMLPVINRLTKSGYTIELLSGCPSVKNIAEGLGLFERVIVMHTLYYVGQFARVIATLHKTQYKSILIPIALKDSLSYKILNKIFLKRSFNVGFGIQGIKYDATITPTSEHVLIQNAKLLEPLDLDMHEEDYEFPINNEYITESKIFLLSKGIGDDDFIVIQPTTKGRIKHKDKCWPAEKYVELINMIITNTYTRIILIGSKNEFEYCSRIVTAVKSNRVIVQAGKTNILVTIGILKMSKMFIGNDSGLMHIAAIIKKPMIILWGPTDFRKLGYSSKNQFIVSLGLECSPCEDTKHEKKCKHRLCLEGIDVSDVFVYVKLLLSNML